MNQVHQVSEMGAAQWALLVGIGILFLVMFFGGALNDYIRTRKKPVEGFKNNSQIETQDDEGGW